MVYGPIYLTSIATMYKETYQLHIFKILLVPILSNLTYQMFKKIHKNYFLYSRPDSVGFFEDFTRSMSVENCFIYCL